jgi:hypothetical protein
VGMGIGVLKLITALKRQGYFPNRSAIIDIGAQQLDDSFIRATVHIAATGRLFDITNPPPSFVRTGPRSDTNLLAGAPHAREFWVWLGLNYACIDVDGTPGSISLDLNYDELPQDLVGKHDTVTNFGSTEHVANQLQAFKIIHDLAKPGGLMLHVLPAGGMLNHGFWSYNPHFFWMLCRSNGYKIAFMTMGQAKSETVFPSNLLEFFATYDLEASFRPHKFAFFRARVLPRRKTKHAALRTRVTFVFAALQKVFDTPFVAPLDVPTGAASDNMALCDRYWSVFKPEISFQARESELLARVRATHDFEQTLSAKQADLERRMRDVYEREQAWAGKEADLESRKRDVYEREQAWAGKEADLESRKRDVFAREQAWAAKEDDLEKRKRDVFAREQAWAAKEDDLEKR